MATLTTIRERQKVILWAFLAIFILSLSLGGLVGGANVIDQIFGSNLTSGAGGGGLSAGVVGAVNSERIPVEQLNQAISFRSQQLRDQFGELTDRQVDQAESQAWDNIVNSLLLGGEIDRRRLATAGDEIYYILQNYPPDIITTNEGFRTDGEFDPGKYYQALNNPVGDEWGEVEYFLANILPGEKMNQLVRAVAFTSEEEVKASWYEANSQATIDFIYVPTGSINTDDLAISENDLEAIYRRDRDSFEQPETRILEYVFWAKSPGAADSAEVRELAAALIARAQAGEDFADLALEYSDDPGSGPSGGDLGWFGRGQMVAPFDAAAFAAQPGEIVGPVATQFGYHVIKVQERKDEGDETRLNARHILLNVNVSSQTLNDTRSQASLFAFDAVDSTFERALQIYELSALTAQPLERAASLLPPPVGRLRSAVRFAYKAEIGEVSDVLENDQGYIVAALTGIRKAGVQPLDEVRATLSRLAREEAAKEQVELIMANIQRQLASGVSWQAIADSVPEAKVSAAVTANLNGSFAGLGRSPTLTGVLKTLVSGEVSRAVALERGEAIVKLVALEKADWSAYPGQRAAEHSILYQRKVNAIWAEWLADLRKQAKIVDNRSYFY